MQALVFLIIQVCKSHFNGDVYPSNFTQKVLEFRNGFDILDMGRFVVVPTFNFVSTLLVGATIKCWIQVMQTDSVSTMSVEFLSKTEQLYKKYSWRLAIGEQPSTLFKVINIGANRLATCDFLLIYNRNYVSNLYHR